MGLSWGYRRPVPRIRLGIPLTLVLVLAACGGPHASSAAAPTGVTGPSGGATSGIDRSPRAAPPAPVTPAATPAARPGCRNGVLPATDRDRVAAADGRPHATEVPGAFFYGTCGGTTYVVTRMRPAPGSSSAAGVPYQDEGADPELLVDRGDRWTVVAHATGPSGCTTSPVLPDQLRALWHQCATGSAPAVPTGTERCAALQQHPLVHLTVVVLQPGGSARLTGTPTTVHCGGPDDVQFIPEPDTVTVDLHSGATVRVARSGPVTVPLPVRQLPAYVASGGATDVFLINGKLNGLVYDATAVTEQWHP